MTGVRLTILHEDPELLVVYKPPGVATTAAPANVPCLLAMAQAHLAQTCGGTPVFLGTCGRLDLPVAGIVVFAKTPGAAARLTEQYRSRSVVKVYQALVSGRIVAGSGSLRHWLRQGGRHAKVRVVSPERADAREAHLTYRVLERYSKATRVELRPLTGRKHQIRVQLAHEGHPIWGDYKYGSRMTFPGGIALLAQGIEILHPRTEQRVAFSLPIPKYWPADVEQQCQRDPTWLGRP